MNSRTNDKAEIVVPRGLTVSDISGGIQAEVFRNSYDYARGVCVLNAEVFSGIEQDSETFSGNEVFELSILSRNEKNILLATADKSDYSEYFHAKCVLAITYEEE